MAAPPFADDRDAPAGEILNGIRQLVEKMRGAAPPFAIPSKIPLGAAVLASMRYRKPLPPELWRRWAFPTQTTNAGEARE